MRLRQLHIDRLPGIQSPIRLDALSDGVTVISGPNAIGKSSLIRALGYLLHPKPKRDPADLILSAGFETSAAPLRRYRVRRTGPSVTWEERAETGDWTSRQTPDLPDADVFQRYLLQIDNLLQAGRVDDQFIKRFQQDLAGGLDPAALADGPFQIQPGLDRQAGAALRTADSLLVRALADSRDLLDAQRRLPGPEAAAEAIARARAVRDLGRKAAELLQVRQDRQAQEALLQQYPEQMAETPDEDRLNELEAQAERHAESERLLRQALSEADRQWRSSGFADHHELPDPAPARAQLAELQRMEQDQRHAAEATAAARAELAGQLELLGAGSAGAGEIGRLLGNHWLRQVESSALAWQQALEQQQGAQARQAVAQAADTDRARAAQTRAGRLRQLALGLGLMLLAALLLLVPVLGQGQWPAATVALLLLVPGAVLVWRTLPAPGQDSTAGPELQALLTAAGRGVTDARERLERLLTEAGLPLDDDATPLATQQLAQRLKALAEARAGEVQAQARQQERERACSALAAGISQWLTRHDPDGRAVTSSDSPTLGAALAGLEARIQSAREAGSERRRLHSQLSALAAERQALQETRDRLCRRCGLEPEQQAELRERIRLRPEWQQRQDAWRQALQQEQLLAADPALSEPAWQALLDRNDPTLLQQRIEQAEQALEQAEAERSAAIELQGRVLERQRELPLEHARFERDRQQERLRQRLDARVRAELGRWLVAGTLAEHQQQHRPAALQQADERLRTFTWDQFGLELDPEGQPRARHLPSDQPRALEALSVGTRMQFLIALRLASLTLAEGGQGEPWPLFLDEALTTTDPLRFQAIARALHRSADREGRQIFYLTAQAEDGRRWQQAVAEDRLTITEHPLAPLQADTPPLELIALPGVPEPDTGDAIAYGQQLGVPAIDPFQGGKLHLFHLLRDDLALLHRLLDRYRLTTLGQLRSFLTRTDPADITPEARTRLHRRIAWTDRWLDLITRDRGKPLPVSALADTPVAVVADRLAEIAPRIQRFNQDAAAVLRSLEADRVHQLGDRRLAELGDWLREQGYLCDGTPLDRLQRRQSFLAGISDADGEEAAALLTALESAASLPGAPETA